MKKCISYNGTPNILETHKLDPPPLFGCSMWSMVGSSVMRTSNHIYFYSNRNSAHIGVFIFYIIYIQRNCSVFRIQLNVAFYDVDIMMEGEIIPLEQR